MRFSRFHKLDLTQHQLDFVDVDNRHDLPLYVDPYAIEVRDDLWAGQASEYLRVFFKEVLDAIRDENHGRAQNLMSHLSEPRETFLGVSQGKPKGRGVGQGQARQLIQAIEGSRAYQTGLLEDLSEMALYVEGIDRDKISDLTTNVIRGLLVKYTQQQCALYNIPMTPYSGPPLWDVKRRNWVSQEITLPKIQKDPVLLVPKYIVRRRLSIDSQEFYNKQITDFLVAENLRANSSLVHVVKGQPKVYKGEVREQSPKSKSFLADMVLAHPELLEMYKDIAKKQTAMMSFDDDDNSPTVSAVCGSLATAFKNVPTGAKAADQYHRLVIGALTALFYPDLIQPHKEWDIHDGRKRVDIVFTNSGESGFFAQRRNDPMVNANTVIVECKNYSNDIANQELDQLLGRFDDNRGKFGIVTCRTVDDPDLLLKRCRDASSRSRGYMIVLTDDDLEEMLTLKSQLKDDEVERILFRKYRDLLA